ncbi:hypothetical protein FCN23_09665 [Campylobacter jejuni]|nr:hypothetical protein FCN23_09665 [Campylobacter jejuni]
MPSSVAFQDSPGSVTTALQRTQCPVECKVSAFDPCLYIKVVDGHCVLILVYVDDVLVTGSSPELISRTKGDLKTGFEMTDRQVCVRPWDRIG